MYYNVAQLLKEPVGSIRTYRVEDSFPLDDGPTDVYALGCIRLMRTDKGVWASGDMQAELWLPCSRCLDRYKHNVKMSIQEEFLPRVAVSTGAPLTVPAEGEGAFIIDPRHALDLQEAVRQYVISDLPMKPLCSADCHGLCLVCGTNKNEFACSCDEGSVDPRWLPMLKLTEGAGN